MRTLLEMLLVLCAVALLSGCSLGQDFDDIEACGENAILDEEGNCACPANLIEDANGDCVCGDSAVLDEVSGECVCEDGLAFRPDGTCGCPVELPMGGDFALPGGSITECSGRVEVLQDILGEPNARLISADALLLEDEQAIVALLQLDSQSRLIATLALLDLSEDGVSVINQRSVSDRFEEEVVPVQGFPLPDAPLSIALLNNPEQMGSTEPRTIVTNRHGIYEVNFEDNTIRTLQVAQAGQLEECINEIPPPPLRDCLDEVSPFFTAATAVRNPSTGDSVLAFVGVPGGENQYVVGSVRFSELSNANNYIFLSDAVPLTNAPPLTEEGRVFLLGAAPLAETSSSLKYVAAANQSVLVPIDDGSQGCPMDRTCYQVGAVVPTILQVNFTSDLETPDGSLGVIDLEDENLSQVFGAALTLVIQVLEEFAPEVFMLGDNPESVMQPLAVSATLTDGDAVSVWQTAAYICNGADGTVIPCGFSESQLISRPLPINLVSGFIEWDGTDRATYVEVIEDATVSAVTSVDPTTFGADGQLDAFAAVVQIEEENYLVLYDFSQRTIDEESIFMRFPFTPRDDAFRIGLFNVGELVLLETADGVRAFELTTAQ